MKMFQFIITHKSANANTVFYFFTLQLSAFSENIRSLAREKRKKERINKQTIGMMIHHRPIVCFISEENADHAPIPLVDNFLQRLPHLFLRINGHVHQLVCKALANQIRKRLAE